MSRRAASFTQADVARAIRAAKAEGWSTVRIVTSGGAIEVSAGEDARDGFPNAPKKRQVIL